MSSTDGAPEGTYFATEQPPVASGPDKRDQGGPACEPAPRTGTAVRDGAPETAGAAKTAETGGAAETAERPGAPDTAVPAETTEVRDIPGIPDGSDETSYLGDDLRPPATRERELGDFTADTSMLRLVPLAVLIGALGAGVALALLGMIGLFTNLFYYQQLSFRLVSPGASHLGLRALLIPLGGGLAGLMARFGSEHIRGHGILEAMEGILINGSRVQPRLAILKPLSSAISIGTGGPFGAEGPIVLTGGAVGSIVGQMFRLTAAQRLALLVAGAAAGMSAVFGTPWPALCSAWSCSCSSSGLVRWCSSHSPRLRPMGFGCLSPAPAFCHPNLFSPCQGRRPLAARPYSARRRSESPPGWERG
jgi:hypothetical protein